MEGNSLEIIFVFQIFAEFLRITAVNAKHKFYEVVALHWLSVVTLTSSKPNRPEVLGVIMDELSKAEGEKQEGKLMEYSHLMHLW